MKGISFTQNFHCPVLIITRSSCTSHYHLQDFKTSITVFFVSNGLFRTEDNFSSVLLN